MKTISINNIKENTLKLNEMVLKTTEKTVLKTIKKAENLQGFTAKTLKNSLTFTEKQQDIFFKTAENAKSKVWKKANKRFGFFGKN